MPDVLGHTRTGTDMNVEEGRGGRECDLRNDKQPIQFRENLSHGNGNKGDGPYKNGFNLL